MKNIIQIIVIPILVILFFSCSLLQDEDQQPSKQVDATWTQLETNSPNIQVEYAMVYDTLHKQIIAYGGRSGNFDNVNETWAFDFELSTWTNLVPSISPPWRANHAMAYDLLRHKVLMFGGDDFTRSFNDLWEYNYDQNRWIELSPDNSPEARQMHGMVYNPNQDVVVMFGGRRTGGGASFNDTWKYSYVSNEWQKLNPTNSPSVQDHVNITYHNSMNKVILFAGTQGNSSPKTWSYDFDTNSWTNLNPMHSPDGDHSSLTYDPYLGKVILFGNKQGSSDMLTWVYDYSANLWTNITPQSMPNIYIEHAAMVYINTHNVFIQYGGCCSNKTLELILNKQNQ